MMYDFDYLNRPVIKICNNVAVVQDSDNSFMVISGLFIINEKVNYKVVDYFARSREEAFEKVKELYGITLKEAIGG